MHSDQLCGLVAGYESVRRTNKWGFTVTSFLISVVDDDESVRRTTKRLIESFGYRASVFESAEVLLRSGELRDISCLIIDINMPRLNGLQLQSRLAAEGYSIPIIFISAY